MTQNSTLYEKQARFLPRKVFFEGTTKLVEGQGVCYNRDYGTATDADGRRDKYVEVPSLTNWDSFAGVTARAYAANTQGQWIEIYEPGSWCKIACRDNVTIGDVAMCNAGIGGLSRSATSSTVGQETGLWRSGASIGSTHMLGPGAAIIRETNASMILSGETDGTGAINAAGLTLTAGAAFSTTPVAGDLVWIYTGNATSNNAVNPGIYTVSSSTTTVCTISETCSLGATDANTCSYAIYRENPTVYAELVADPRPGACGMFADISCIDGASSLLPAGLNVIGGGDAATTNGLGVPADGTYNGQQVGFVVASAIATSDMVLTPATAGIQRGVTDQVSDASADGTPLTLTTITLDAATEACFLEWYFEQWREITGTVSGATLAE